MKKSKGIVEQYPNQENHEGPKLATPLQKGAEEDPQASEIASV